MSDIDTSKEGFEYAGIKLTEQQYEDLIALNLQMQLHKDIPIFGIMMLLKILGVLPKKMMNDNSNNLNEDSEDWFYKRYGKRK